MDAAVLLAVGCPLGNEAELGRYRPQLPYDGAVQREPSSGTSMKTSAAIRINRIAKRSDRRWGSIWPS
jgi:hypothetical protein